MIDIQTACDRAAQLVDYAKRAGADDGDAMATASMSQTISVRLGALEDADRSEDDGISLRVFVGKRSASVSGSDVGADAMADMAERAVAMARHAPEDPYARIATPDELAQGPFADLDLTDDAAPSAETLRSRAEAVEDAARAVAGITNSDGGSAGTGRSVAAMATSAGFVAGYAATSHYMSASVIAGEGATMQRDHFARSARHAADLPSAQDIGRQAGERTVARLDPAGVGSATLPVLFDPRVSPTLIGHLLGAMNGMAAARRATFLLDRMDDPLFPEAITIREEPHRPRGMRSRPFDGEGLATQPRALVEHGRATGWLTNLAAAAQLGIAPTGHGMRGGSGAPGIATANVVCAAGACSRTDMIADIADGILVTELIGQGVNGITGDYSRAASGRRIRNGELAEAVSGFTIAGNLVEMYSRMEAADDLDVYRAFDAPTLRIDAMTIAGD